MRMPMTALRCAEPTPDARTLSLTSDRTHLCHARTRTRGGNPLALIAFVLTSASALARRKNKIMLSIAATSPLSFAGPSSGLAFTTARAPTVHMIETPPIFSELDDSSDIKYRTPSPNTPDFDPNTFAQTLPGISPPLGFFDPAGFCASSNGADGAATEGKVRFYREVELKHGRVAMLAALGFPIAEQFHPLFGGTVDTNSFSAFQQTPLQTFWPAVVFAISLIEVLSVIPAFENPNVEGWAIRSDHTAGDYGFDPLGLKPQDPAELAEMQTKEINNGRLAMIAIAGMVVQEAVTGGKLF